MRSSILVYFIAPFACGFAIAAEKPVNLFLLAGQPNMDGCGHRADLSEKWRETAANVRIWGNRQQEWKQIGEDGAAIARKLMSGPGVVFSHRIAKAFPEHAISLVKISADCTSLDNSCLPEKNKMYPRLIACCRNAVEAEDPRAHLVSTDDLSSLKDNTHFDSEGLMKPASTWPDPCWRGFSNKENCKKPSYGNKNTVRMACVAPSKIHQSRFPCRRNPDQFEHPRHRQS